MRITSDNEKPIYLPYKSAEQVVSEAMEEHERKFSALGWLSVGTVLFFLFLHDFGLYFVFKSLFG